MDAMAYVIVKEGLQDQDFLDRCCLGFDKEHMPDGVEPSECYLSWLTGEQDGIEKRRSGLSQSPGFRLKPFAVWQSGMPQQGRGH